MGRNSNPQTQLGKLIRSARLRLDLTQAELSEKLGYKDQGQYVSDLECGRRTMRVRMLFPLARALQIESLDIIKAIEEDHEKKFASPLP